MNPNSARLVAIAVSILLVSSHAAANDSFRPGDAFFLSRLGEDSIREWDSFLNGTSDEFVLTYKLPSDWTYLRHIAAGNHQLLIKGISRERVQTLSSLYHWLRKQPGYFRSDVTFYDERGKKKTQEQGPFYLLVYNRDFGGKLHELGQEGAIVGLLYNELWMHGGIPPALKSARKIELDPTEGDSALKPKFGMGGQSSDNEPLWQYRTLLPGSDAVVEDWKHAKDVPGLKVTSTGSVPEEMGARRTAPKPLEISVENIQFIIVPQSPSLNDENFFESFHKRVEGSEVFVVVGDDVKRCQWKEDPETEDVILEVTQLEIPQ